MNGESVFKYGISADSEVESNSMLKWCMILGPNEIPNIVLKSCSKLIVPFLLQIFRVALGLHVYVAEWRYSNTPYRYSIQALLFTPL